MLKVGKGDDIVLVLIFHENFLNMIFEITSFACSCHYPRMLCHVFWSQVEYKIVCFISYRLHTTFHQLGNLFKSLSLHTVSRLLSVEVFSIISVLQ